LSTRYVKYVGGNAVATKAHSQIHGIVSGGQIIEAEIVHLVGGSPEVASVAGVGVGVGANAAQQAASDVPTPIYSGDKVLPERYLWVSSTGVREVINRITVAGAETSELDGMFGRLSRVLVTAIDDGMEYDSALGVL